MTASATAAAATVTRPPVSLSAAIRPVEYAVAVDRYLAAAMLSPASRRIYRISLISWCWPLVGRQPPPGRCRRGAVPPVVPLALLDDRAAGARLAIAVAERSASAGPRTVSRELSALRGAIGWWQDLDWIASDPTAGLRCDAGRAGAVPALPALTFGQLTALWRSEASLREHAFWHLLYDSAAPAPAVLRLDAARLDLARGTAAAGPGPEAPSRPGGPGGPIRWSARTSDLLGWLLAGRRHGPVFLTGRRAPAGAAAADTCPVTGKARLSYRRAAEIFTGHTRPLDPAGRGWTLHQLTLAARRPA